MARGAHAALSPARGGQRIAAQAGRALRVERGRPSDSIHRRLGQRFSPEGSAWMALALLYFLRSSLVRRNGGRPVTSRLMVIASLSVCRMQGRQRQRPRRAHALTRGKGRPSGLSLRCALTVTGLRTPWLRSEKGRRHRFCQRRNTGVRFNLIAAGRRVLQPVRSNKMVTAGKQEVDAERSSCQRPLLTPRNPKEVARRWHSPGASSFDR